MQSIQYNTVLYIHIANSNILLFLCCFRHYQPGAEAYFILLEAQNVCFVNYACYIDITEISLLYVCMYVCMYVCSVIKPFSAASVAVRMRRRSITHGCMLC